MCQVFHGEGVSMPSYESLAIISAVHPGVSPPDETLGRLTVVS